VLKQLKKRLREIQPAEFRKMELKAAKVTADLLGLFHGNFRRTIEAIDDLMARPNYGDAVWRGRFHRLSHDLRGLGGTFNYELVTMVGESLCRLIQNDALPSDRSLQRRIMAHVAALRAILQFDLKGDGGDEGEALLVTLKMKPARRRAH
jgi:hypothetical protein